MFKRSGGRIRFCLIASRGRKIWGLPKGHVERRETPVEAAVREVGEETGLRVSPLCKLGVIHYTFAVGMTRFYKRVHFFLFKRLGGSTRDHDSEVDEARWLSAGEALRKMSYPGERSIFKKALQILRRGMLG